MEFDIQNLALGGVGVGMAWMAKESFSFFLNLRKQDREQERDHFYKPDEQWKKYCTDKFESISDTVTGLKTSHELMKNQLCRLELEVIKISK